MAQKMNGWIFKAKCDDQILSYLVKRFNEGVTSPIVRIFPTPSDGHMSSGHSSSLMSGSYPIDPVPSIDLSSCFLDDHTPVILGLGE